MTVTHSWLIFYVKRIKKIHVWRVETFQAEPGTEVSPPWNTTLLPMWSTCVCFPQKTFQTGWRKFPFGYFTIASPGAAPCLAWQLHRVSGGSFHFHVQVLISLAELSFKLRGYYKHWRPNWSQGRLTFCRTATRLSTLQLDGKPLSNTRKTRVHSYCILPFTLLQDEVWFSQE